MNSLSIVIVSDEPLGMGSPQVLSFAISVAEYCGTRAAIICPRPTDKLSVSVSHPLVEVVQSEFAAQMRFEYIRFVHSVLKERSPDVLIFFSNLALPVLLQYRKRPKLTINYVLESYYFSSSTFNREAQLLKAVQDRVDMFIVPELNRAAQVVQAGGLDARRVRVLYNCKRYERPPLRRTATERNGILLHQGSIFVDEEPWLYLYETPERFAIDIYGIHRTKTSSPVFREQFDGMCRTHSDIRYLGKVTEHELEGIRAGYSYVLTYWHPSDPTQHYACPNKFFEAIASGVPPLASPNPQMRELIERYDCGILLDNWTYQAFREGYEYAMEIRDSERYAELVANCVSAYESALNWESQFRKILPTLAQSLDTGGVHVA